KRSIHPLAASVCRWARARLSSPQCTRASSTVKSILPSPASVVRKTDSSALRPGVLLVMMISRMTNQLDKDYNGLSRQTKRPGGSFRASSEVTRPRRTLERFNRYFMVKPYFSEPLAVVSRRVLGRRARRFISPHIGERIGHPESRRSETSPGTPLRDGVPDPLHRAGE